ncbi:40S ribosomal protein S4 [Castilleja foliolosa]|uniref:Small ribosomal subunit protein uS4c n=1 Tax=Castilleja foliolosa TaxID=1961234 RepID=A0ABD3E1Z0_9LAMI
MSRYRGPRFKKIRRLGALPGLTNKRPKVGTDLRNQSRSGKKSQYRIRLEEKQKLRFHYGLTERQLLKYVRIAGKAKGSTGQVLLQLLEMRLDNILFRLGMASTIPAARQLVNHRHVLVNGRIVDIPSYRCKPRDNLSDSEMQFDSTIRELFDCFLGNLFLLLLLSIHIFRLFLIEIIELDSLLKILLFFLFSKQHFS